MSTTYRYSPTASRFPLTMSNDVVIRIENLSKQYRLGLVGTGTLSHDINRWWHRVRGKEDPYLKVTEVNDRTKSARTNSKDRVTLGPCKPLSPGNNQSLANDYVWALKDINLEVKQGEVLGVIGRNGAGKSTLLKVLSRITAPTTGQVRIKGRTASLLEVGTGFHGELTGRENIYLNGAIMGMSKAEVRGKLDEIVDFSGCERYIDTPVKRYSSGMMVRLGFAVAAHLEPEILIVDEVLAVGDASFQKKCIGKMKDVAGHGRTVLFVSHNMAAVDALCQKALILNNGSVVFSGNVSETLDYYANSSRTENEGKVLFTGAESERFGDKEYSLLKSIELTNAEGETTNHFRMGDKMLINISAEIHKPSEDYEIGVGVSNLRGVFPHYFVSPWEGFSSITKTGLTNIEIEVPRVVLFPGGYTLRVWICIRGAYYDDAVHNAMSFTVSEGKVNNECTYFERFSQNTQVYVKTLWRIK
jgi:lipopolysaccharide transport system ATP-binding protein